MLCQKSQPVQYSAGNCVRKSKFAIVPVKLKMLNLQIICETIPTLPRSLLSYIEHHAIQLVTIALLQVTHCSHKENDVGKPESYKKLNSQPEIH